MNSLYRKTPIMGWASWNAFRTHISEDLIKKQADALVSTGLKEYGYTYLNVDDGFFGGRDKNGHLKFHKERFPNGIKVIADYVHSLGLNAGIYSEAGDNTCGFYWDGEGENGNGVGLYRHEEQDLELYLQEYGFDFIKVDWCGGLRLGLDEEEQYTKIGRIIDEIRRRTGRCIVYNICRWQFPGPWVEHIADSWRTGGDITPEFESVLHQIDEIKSLARYCGPGHVNDLDMMQIGNGLTLEQEKTHFAMWCMMSTPLIIGCDLTKISAETLAVLKNRELIALNQDTACLQAEVIRETTGADGNLVGEIWVKDLGKRNSNEKAIAFLNRSDTQITLELNLPEAGLLGEIKSIRDLCNHSDLECAQKLTVQLAPCAAVVYRIVSERAAEIENAAHEIQENHLNMLNLSEMEGLIKDGAVLVDVRTPQEYQSGHLVGAVNIPYTDIHAAAVDLLKDKSAQIIVYCTTGKRSSQAAKSLEYLGYTNVCCFATERTAEPH